MEIVELITPLGAVFLFGKSTPTVRLAIREGKVRTEIELHIEQRPIRLIELESAIKYWGKDYQYFESELKELHRGAFMLQVVGFKYKILHLPGYLATRPPNAETETWFRLGSGNDD